MNYIEQKYKHIQLEKIDQTLLLLLNRPEQRNALSQEMIFEIAAVLEHADEDQEILSLVISGNGKSFCAGGDLELMKYKQGMFEGDPLVLRKNYQKYIQTTPKAIEKFSKPIIAMVNGAAVGAGFDLSLMCDLRIASDKAKFGAIFSKLGLVPGDGGTFFLTRVVGYSKAMEMFLTAKIYDAQEAQELGLISTIVDSGDLKEVTLKLCREINQLPSESLILTKKALKQAYRASLEDQLETLSTYQGIVQNSSDHLEYLKKLK